MRGHLIVDLPLFTLAGALAPWFPWGLAAAAGLSLATHTWAVTDPHAGLYLPVCWFLRDCPDAVALTFDDGPDPATTPAILDLLAAVGARATFFPIGANAAAHPDLVRRIHRDGHALGLHSQRHPRTFPVLPPRRLRAELADNAALLADLTGASPQLFRPPMGLKTPLLALGLRGLDLAVVTWTAAGGDTGRRSPEAIRRRLGRTLRPGAILLLHDGSEPRHQGRRQATVAALRGLLADLQRSGLGSRALRVVDGRVAPVVPGGDEA